MTVATAANRLAKWLILLVGGGRSRSRTGLHSQIPCEQGKEQGILQNHGFWHARDSE